MGGSGREESILPTERGSGGLKRGLRRGQKGQNGSKCQNVSKCTTGKNFPMVPAPIDEPHHWVSAMGGGSEGPF